jgi:hypothetical protein
VDDRQHEIASVGALNGAEACLYLAVAPFGAQALVILMSPGGRAGAATGDGR